MSTRGMYTFKGDCGDWNVYKHSDNYPIGAAETLAVAQSWFTWKAPRYESDEFACAFIAAGKSNFLGETGPDMERLKEYKPGGRFNDYSGGGVRLMPQGDPLTVACENCSDIQYRYEIAPGNDGELRICAYDVDAWDAPGSETLIINCKLADFPKLAKSYEDKQKAA